MCRAAAVIKMKADMSGVRGFVRGRREGGERGSAPGEPPAPPHPARAQPRPRQPRLRKSRLVMVHRDRETSGICLKSIKENHYFLENPLPGCHSPEEASFSSEPVPDSNQLCQSQALPGQKSSSAQGTGPRLGLQDFQKAAVGLGAGVASCWQALIESTEPWLES